MARTYSGVPEPRFVERAKFADNGGGGGSGDNIVIVPLVFNMEDPSLSYLDITAKELFDLLQTEKIILVKGSIVYSEEGYTDTIIYSSPIGSGEKETIAEATPDKIYTFSVELEGLMYFSAHADDEKPLLQS